MYQALYRKWRPKTFDEVVGQEHITQTLKNQVKTGRLSHAYLFIGTRGTGKTTCAKILAKAVNCETPVNGNPCGKCPACRGIEHGSVMDIVELDAASNNGVDNVRALRDEAVFSPASVKKRVYIVDEVHMLSTAAFNALLKILEEPPEHLMFILATTELNKVPATILSRCQRHSFKRLDPGVITKQLEYIAGEEHFDLEHDAAELIARLAEGGMRDALSLLDQCSGSEHITVDAVYSSMGLAGKRSVSQLLGHISDHDTAASLTLFRTMWQDGRDPATILGELSGLMRDVLMTIVAPKGGAELLSGGYDGQTLAGFAGRLTSAELIAQMEEIQSALSCMKTAGNPRTAAELCLISLCEPQLLDGMDELRARVSRLEAALENGAVTVPAPEAEKKRPVKKAEPQPDIALPEAPPVPPAAAYDAPPWDDEPQREDEPPHDDDFGAPAPDCGADEVFTDSSSADEPAPVDGGWREIVKRAEPLLPPGLRIYIGDSAAISGVLEADSLRIYAAPGIVYSQFSAQNIVLTLRQAAGDALGRPINVTVSERRGDTDAVKRDIEELKKFKEVHFTGGN